MTAAASAEQRAYLKFFAVIDHATAKWLGYALDGLINVPHPLSPFSINLERRRVKNIRRRCIFPVEQAEMLLEPDHGHRRVQRIQFSDLGMFAIFVVFGVFDRQAHRVDIVVKRIPINAGDAHKSAEADS